MWRLTNAMKNVRVTEEKDRVIARDRGIGGIGKQEGLAADLRS